MRTPPACARTRETTGACAGVRAVLQDDGIMTTWAKAASVREPPPFHCGRPSAGLFVLGWMATTVKADNVRKGLFGGLSWVSRFVLGCGEFIYLTGTPK